MNRLKHTAMFTCLIAWLIYRGFHIKLRMEWLHSFHFIWQ